MEGHKMSQPRIVFTNPGGSVGVLIPTGEVPIEAVMAKDVPDDASNARFITTDDLPNRTFRNAWTDGLPGEQVDVDMPKAKTLAHDMRRANREELFRPYDEIIAKQVPGSDSAKAEQERKKIRDADDVNQIAMDAAITPAELEALLP